MAPLRVGIIGGTGVYALEPGEPLEVETAWGTVPFTLLKWGRTQVLFVPRHGPRHERPSHRVEYRALVGALRSAHVDYVLAVNNVGSLRKEIPPASWLVPHDLLDLTRQRRATFHDDEAVHVDLQEPYCPHTRAALIGAARAADRGVYAAVEGPRFETAAETEALVRLGATVVGMTGAPEAILAREAGLCYASLCWVGNRAAGLQARVAARPIVLELARRRATVRRILRGAISKLPRKKNCRCAERARGARITALVRGGRP